MAFLKSLINRIAGNKNTDDSQGRLDQYYQLVKLRDRHDWIDVRINRSDRSYQSMILDIDVENGELLIDDLYPPEGVEQLQAGDAVHITSSSRNALIDFSSRILARETGSEQTLFKLELPTEIGHSHQSGAYRVYVEKETALSLVVNQAISLIANQPPTSLPAVSIINLSSETIKLCFDDEYSSGEHPQRRPELQACELRGAIIQLPDGSDVHCDITLGTVYSIRTPQPHFLCNGKLNIEDPQQRVKLQQYLATVQRQQRRATLKDS